MSATVILSPSAAAETVCHEEQLRIWADDHIIDALAQEGYFRDDRHVGDQEHYRKRIRPSGSADDQTTLTAS